jgi:hypothetical protein
MSSLDLRARRKAMAIADRNLSVGTKLWARYKGSVHTALVGQTDDGETRYFLTNAVGEIEHEFKSPSAAGTAITGKACNGWAFWSVGEPGESTPTSTVNAAPKPERKRGRKAKGEGEAPSEGPVLPIIERLDEQFECGECGSVFPTRDEASEHVTEIHPA